MHCRNQASLGLTNTARTVKEKGYLFKVNNKTTETEDVFKKRKR
jgi:hypothetical protein